MGSRLSSTIWVQRNPLSEHLGKSLLWCLGCFKQGRLSQPWHDWHLGPEDSVSGGCPLLYRMLAPPLASTYQMPVTSAQLWQLKMPPSRLDWTSPGRQNRCLLRTVGGWCARVTSALMSASWFLLPVSRQGHPMTQLCFWRTWGPVWDVLPRWEMCAGSEVVWIKAFCCAEDIYNFSPSLPSWWQDGNFEDIFRGCIWGEMGVYLHIFRYVSMQLELFLIVWQIN